MHSNCRENPTAMTQLVVYAGDGDGDGNGEGEGECGEPKLSDVEYLMQFPPGYRFRPTDKECILEYLMKKINNEPLPPNLINTAELYAHSPDYLTAIFPSIGEKEWFFFSPREKKYKGGQRPDRAAGDGRWKATSGDCDVFHNGMKIGSRRVLTYMKGKSQHLGTKTDWLMHEFRAINSSTTQQNSMRLDDWVLCKVYKRKTNSGKRRTNNMVNMVEENAAQKKMKSSRKRNHEEVVKDGEVNNIMAYNEAARLSVSVDSSAAPNSGQSSNSSYIDHALFAYPFNHKRLCPESEPSYRNIYEETNNEGLDNAAMNQHFESYQQFSTASPDFLDVPLPSFPQQMPSDLYGQYGQQQQQQAYDEFNVEQHHYLPQLNVQRPYPFSSQPSYSSSSHGSLLPLPYHHRQQPAFQSGSVNGMPSYSHHHV